MASLHDSPLLSDGGASYAPRDPDVARSTPKHGNDGNDGHDGGGVGVAVAGGGAGLFTARKERVFGGTAADRSLPCKLFSRAFDKANEEFEEREFDFVFRHGTLVLRVEEDRFGRVSPIVRITGYSFVLARTVQSESVSIRKGLYEGRSSNIRYRPCSLPPYITFLGATRHFPIIRLCMGRGAAVLDSRLWQA